MLHLDLNRLRREGRARIDADVPPGAEFWSGLDLEPVSPLEVRLEAQQAGADVVVRGTIRGRFRDQCGRCLEPVVVVVSDDLDRLYREGEDLVEEEPDDVLPLPAGSDLDLTEPVREQVLLAAPPFIYCREDCRGLCPTCGSNLNETTCECTVDDVDERWAPLRQLRSDE